MGVDLPEGGVDSSDARGVKAPLFDVGMTSSGGVCGGSGRGVLFFGGEDTGGVAGVFGFSTGGVEGGGDRGCGEIGRGEAAAVGGFSLSTGGVEGGGDRG